MLVPVDDVLEGVPDSHVLAELTRERERYTPEDMLAVAFNGLARRHMRGAIEPGEEIPTLAASLRGLADALEAFNNYRPGTFLALDEIFAAMRPQDNEEEKS